MYPAIIKNMQKTSIIYTNNFSYDHTYNRRQSMKKKIIYRSQMTVLQNYTLLSFYNILHKCFIIPVTMCE